MLLMLSNTSTHVNCSVHSNIFISALVWFGLVSLFKQGKPLASGYYSRHPVKYSNTKGQKHNSSEIQISKSHADLINIKGKDHVCESK